MATVPTMRTWSTGEVVAAAHLNSDVRDAGNFLLSPPLAVLRSTVAQSVPNATYTPALLDAEDLDRDSAHSTVTNTARLTSQTPGWYSAQGTLVYASNVTGLRIITFGVTGVNTLNGTTQVPAVATGGSGTIVTGTATLYLGPGDYLDIRAYQTSGGALNITNAYLSALRISS